MAIVNLLLAHGADPNIRVMNKRYQANNDLSLTGATPLLLAAEVNNIDAVKALLEAGAGSVDHHRAGDDGPHVGDWGRLGHTEQPVEEPARASDVDRDRQASRWSTALT